MTTGYDRPDLKRVAKVLLYRDRNGRACVCVEERLSNMSGLNLAIADPNRCGRGLTRRLVRRHC